LSRGIDLRIASWYACPFAYRLPGEKIKSTYKRRIKEAADYILASANLNVTNFGDLNEVCNPRSVTGMLQFDRSSEAFTGCSTGTVAEDVIEVVGNSMDLETAMEVTYIYINTYLSFRAQIVLTINLKCLQFLFVDRSCSNR